MMTGALFLLCNFIVEKAVAMIGLQTTGLLSKVSIASLILLNIWTARYYFRRSGEFIQIIYNH